MTRAPSTLVLALLAAGAIVGCGGPRKQVPADEVVGAVRALPYSVVVHQAPRPAGTKLFVKGRLRDRESGAALDFAVLVGIGVNVRHPELTVPGATASSGGACADAGIVTTDTEHETDAVKRDRMEAMAARLERAIWAFAPGATCAP